MDATQINKSIRDWLSQLECINDLVDVHEPEFVDGLWYTNLYKGSRFVGLVVMDARGNWDYGMTTAFDIVVQGALRKDA